MESGVASKPEESDSNPDIGNIEWIFFTVNCNDRKDENKEIFTGNAPFMTTVQVARVWFQYLSIDSNEYLLNS